MEKFEDELGEIRVSKTSIERDRDQEMWDEISEEIDRKIIDKVHFSEIEEFKQQPEASPPVLKIKLRGSCFVMPFSKSESCGEVFKKFRYNYHAFQQNY